MKWVVVLAGGVLGLSLPVELASETALEKSVPFFFGLSIDNSGRNVGGILPGFTFAAPAASEDIAVLERVAPSQYQHNRWRNGGLRVGGRNVHILHDELLKSVMKTALFDTLPIPIDFVSGLAFQQSGRRLPAFLGSLSSERLLEEWPHPVWQIWRDDLQNLKEWPTLTPHLSPRLRDMVTENSKLDLVALAIETRTGQLLPQLRLYYRDAAAEKNGGSYISAVQEEVKLTGLTGVMRTKRSLHLRQEHQQRGCRLMIDYFMPRETYVDGDELKRHREQFNMTIILPHFHEIELPAHLAAPAIFQEAIELNGEEFGGDNLITDDFGISFHNRYRLRTSEAPSTSSEFSICRPVLSIDCGREITLLSESHISIEGDARMEDGRLALDSPEIGRGYLNWIASITSLYVFCSIIAIHKEL